jgi:fumarylacetoacetase
VFQPSAVIDYELEIGCFIGGSPNPQGDPIPLSQATDHIFGLVLMNDWSARDIQRWESTPLGPFNSKNWATSISPWIVTPFALEPFQYPAPVQDPPPLPYLSEEHYSNSSKRYNYDINLTATLFPSSTGTGTGSSDKNTPKGTVLTRTNLKDLYWTLPQMITHHTSGGCPMMPGDMIATGTVSIAGDKGQGCMLELSWAGSRGIPLDGDGDRGEGGEGGERTFLEDGDCLVLTGYCEKKNGDDDSQGGGYRIGFGECRGVLLPALERCI